MLFSRAVVGYKISIRAKCEMLDFGAVKCDIHEMRIIDVKLVSCESIVQIRLKILRRPFRGRYILEDYPWWSVQGYLL